MAEQNKEVKEFIINEEGEEVVNPELLKERETQSDSSTEENQEEINESATDETDTTDEEVEENVVEDEVISIKEPKPVDGETPRERALRLEIERLREKSRKDKTDSLLSGVEIKPEMVETSKDPFEGLSEYEKEEIERLDKAFDILAEKKGFVKKDYIEKQSFTNVANDVLNDFIDSHPEYQEKNDPDGVVWNKFSEEFKLFKEPKTPKELKVILNKVHSNLYGGTKINSSAIAAKQTKVKTAAHGGISTSKSIEENTNRLDPSLKQHLKGFTPEELKEMGLE